jgi:two-component system chemotaxis response regulator CheY
MTSMADLSVLVVDDVNTMRTQLKEIMRSIGIQKVLGVSNGEEAKLVLETENIHLVVCDWHMSPTDGLEVLKFLRSHPTLGKTVGFLMLTAEGTKEKVLVAIQAGVDDYVMKPVSPAQVLAKIQNVMKKRNL